MGEQFIMLGVAVLVVFMGVYLFKGSVLMQSIKKLIKGITITKPGEVEVVGGPEIKYREESEVKYRSVIMKKKEFKIGHSNKNDLIFESRKVEDNHAVIYKRLKDNRVYYELVNYGKVNPVEYYNKEREKYECLRYREGVELDIRDAFYIGNMKVITTIPVNMRKPSDTENIKDIEISEKKSIFYEETRTDSERIINKNEIDI